MSPRGPRGERVEARGALPAYTVRVSERARHIRLTITPRDGLVVTLPRGVPRTAIEPVLRAKRAWLEHHLAETADRRALHEAGPEALLPDTIELPAFGLALPVDYRHTSSASVRAVTVDGTVRVSGAVDDADACLAALRRWLDREAHGLLLPLLAQHAAATGLEPSSAVVRRQRSRWGSCSAKGRIALSRNLVFLPRPLVDAVVLHELAHLRVLDHSPRFWAALAEYDPDALAHRTALKRAGHHVPPWADA